MLIPKQLKNMIFFVCSKRPEQPLPPKNPQADRITLISNRPLGSPRESGAKEVNFFCPRSLYLYMFVFLGIKMVEMDTNKY